jgi:hypothetical protein
VISLPKRALLLGIFHRRQEAEEARLTLRAHRHGGDILQLVDPAGHVDPLLDYGLGLVGGIVGGFLGYGASSVLLVDVASMADFAGHILGSASGEAAALVVETDTEEAERWRLLLEEAGASEVRVGEREG